MNKQIKALKMAIEALEEGFGTLECEGMLPHRYQETIQACKEALAEAENPELVAVQYLYKFDKDNPEMIPLYTHPATWHSLSDDEIDEIWVKSFGSSEIVHNLDFARAIEQALKELNAKK